LPPRTPLHTLSLHAALPISLFHYERVVVGHEERHLQLLTAKDGAFLEPEGAVKSQHGVGERYVVFNHAGILGSVFRTFSLCFKHLNEPHLWRIMAAKAKGDGAIVAVVTC